MSSLSNYSIASHQNLLDSTRDLMIQPQSMHKSIKIYDNSYHKMINKPVISHRGIPPYPYPTVTEEGSFLPSKTVHHSGGNKKIISKKVKQIDTYTKVDLEKIAKKNEVSLKTRDGKIKTKQQLFDSLKRKKII
jgi:hypothetical protein